MVENVSVDSFLFLKVITEKNTKVNISPKFHQYFFATVASSSEETTVEFCLFTLDKIIQINHAVIWHNIND